MIQRAMGFPESSISGTLVVCPVAHQRGGGAAGGRPLERLRVSDVICRPTTFLETAPLMTLPTAACYKKYKKYRLLSHQFLLDPLLFTQLTFDTPSLQL